MVTFSVRFDSIGLLSARIYQVVSPFVLSRRLALSSRRRQAPFEVESRAKTSRHPPKPFQRLRVQYHALRTKSANYCSSPVEGCQEILRAHS